MAKTFVQSNSTKTNSASVASLAVAYSSNVTSGNCGFAVVHYYNAAVTVTMSDTRTGTGWTQVGSAINQGPNVITSHIFYGTFASSGACTVTASFSTNTSYGGLAIFEYSGFGTLALQGSGQSAKGNSTAPSLTFSTTQADTLVIVGYLSNSGGSASFTGATIRERANFSTLFQSNQANEDINTSAASQTYSATQSSGHWILHAAEFYDSGGGGTTYNETVSMGMTSAFTGSVTLTGSTSGSMGQTAAFAASPARSFSEAVAFSMTESMTATVTFAMNAIAGFALAATQTASATMSGVVQVAMGWIAGFSASDTSDPGSGGGGTIEPRFFGFMQSVMKPFFKLFR